MELVQNAINRHAHSLVLDSTVSATASSLT